MRLNSIAVLLAILIGGTAMAQPQYSNWYFGFGAGLDMSTATPTPLQGTLSTDEGVASMSDANGEIMFYTNGQSVWQRDHAEMPNGWGLNGHFSASQSVLIVPLPGEDERYYVFTVPAEAGINGGPNAFHWSMVDMTMNGGMGDVSIKNTELTGPVTEKLAAARHADGRDVWVIVHGWNNSEYHAYLVSCSGIDGPVTSTVGRPMTMDPNGTGTGAIGCMQFDPDGERLAAVWSDLDEDYTGSVLLDVVAFDKESGTFSDAIMDTHAGEQPGDLLFGYGVCFSPSGQRLYMSEYGLQSGMGYNKVWQYAMEDIDPMDNEVAVGSSGTAFGTMQRTPDGRIFIGRTNGATYLGSIAEPDEPGASCGFSANNISLGGVFSTWGLPNNWDSYTEPDPLDPIRLRDTTLCGVSTGVLLDATWQHPFYTASYLWSTGETTPSITVNGSGEFHVQVMLPCSTLYGTVRVTTGGVPVDLGPDLSLCEGQEVMLAAGSEHEQYLWNTGDTVAAIIVREPGTYSVIITDSIDCSTSDEVMIAMRDCSCPLYMPNSFTPNEDGINDTFGAVSNCTVLSYALVLFDRWGNEVFRTDSPDVFWGGEVRNEDALTTLYVWQLSYSWDDGEAIQRMDRKGHVTVLR